MPYDDDKFGRIWPTRQGNAIGGARERQMLDAIGGSESFRTRYSYNADGSVTEMRTKDGMPQFITKKKKIPAAILGDSLFYGIPSSDSYLGGYTPSSYPGAVHVWHGWSGASAIPNSVAEGGSPMFTPEAAVTTTDPGDGAPGSITWYSDSVKVGTKRIVISWHGDGIRHGRYDKLVYGSLSHQSREQWNYMPSLTQTYHLTGDVLSTASNPAPFIWLNGTTRIRIKSGGSDLAVHSAALTKSGSTGTLTVINGTTVYSGTLALTVTSGGVESIDPALHNTDVTVTAVVTMSPTYGAVLMQWPYINASATKAVLLLDTFSSTAGDQILYEADLTTGAVTPVTNGTSREATTYQNDTGTYADNSYNHVTTVSGTVTESDAVTDVTYTGCAKYEVVTSKTWIAGADYVGDTLVFITMTFENRLGGSEWSYSDYSQLTLHRIDASNVSRTGQHSLSGTTTTYPSYGVAKITHSLYGVVNPVTLAHSGSLITSRTGSGGPWSGTNPNINLWTCTDTVTESGSMTSSYLYEFALLNADLRTNSYLVYTSDTETLDQQTRWATYLRNITGTGEYISAFGGGTFQHIDSHYRLVAIVGGTKVSEQISTTVASETTGTTSAVWAPYPRMTGGSILNPTASSMSSSSRARAPHSFASTYGSPPPCHRVAHLAASDDGTATYIGAASPDASLTIEGFVFSGALVTIPAGKYVSGGSPTIAQPVFFP